MSAVDFWRLNSARAAFAAALLKLRGILLLLERRGAPGVPPPLLTETGAPKIQMSGHSDI